jgi:alkylation response protein AidB-like acyl-CoA dehydrogenase
MDLSLGDRQQELGRVARQLFDARSPLTTVRELEESDVGYSPDLWQEMARLDWLGLAVPEALGGPGGSLVDLTVLYRELGRALVPSPHLASAVIASDVLGREGLASRRDLLARMMAGDAVVVPALVEPDAGWGPDAITMAARPTTDGFRLHGTKLLVPYAHVAHQLLVAARTASPPDGITLFLVDPADPAVAIEHLPNIAGMPLFAVTFNALDVEPEAVVGEVDRGWQLLGPALDRAAVLRGAEIVGAGERLLAMSVAYANQRRQFGRPIGQFQAVQYLCTDIAIDTHLTDLFTRQAAWRLDHGFPARREVALAKGYASRAAQRIVHRAHEVHAGVAFMLETDVQLFTRRVKHWELDLGDARHHDETVAASLELLTG